MRGLTPAGVIHLTPNVWTEPFWTATAQHRLVLPRCTACAAYRFPPTPFCWRCRAQDVDWIEHDGHGTRDADRCARRARAGATRCACGRGRRAHADVAGVRSARRPVRGDA